MIDPPETDEMTSTRRRIPSSASRARTPTWKSAARNPPPDRASPIFAAEADELAACMSTRFYDSTQPGTCQRASSVLDIWFCQSASCEGTTKAGQPLSAALGVRPRKGVHVEHWRDSCGFTPLDRGAIARARSGRRLRGDLVPGARLGAFPLSARAARAGCPARAC